MTVARTSANRAKSGGALPFWLTAALMLGVALFAPTTALCLEPPGYRGYVNDYADMISPAVEAKIERALASFDLSDSTQIAVLTVATLDGDSLEEFTIRTAEKWGLGEKGKDNGVLLLVAKEERKARIEVGSGLEGVLTDLLAGRIVDQVITPQFRQGKFDQGFEAGIASMISATRGEFKAPADSRRRSGRSRDSQPGLGYLLLPLLLIAFLGQVSRPLGAISGAALLPLAGFLSGISLGLVGLLLLIPVGALGGLLLPLLLTSHAAHRGMYLGGGGFGGGGSGGGFGGFGGGGFGGGGASGNW